MHMKELPIHHVIYCAQLIINIVMSNNVKHYHVHFTQFFQ